MNSSAVYPYDVEHTELLRYLSEAMTRSMITAEEARDSYSQAIGATYSCGSDAPKAIADLKDDNVGTPTDHLKIRMQLEKIPFLEAVKLMGFCKAIQYQFQRPR